MLDKIRLINRPRIIIQTSCNFEINGITFRINLQSLQSRYNIGKFCNTFLKKRIFNLPLQLINCRIFLDLIGRSNTDKDGVDGNGDGGADTSAGTNNSPGPPLPVKRCLASSVHALAHMLGPDIVSKDTAFLAAFEKSFLRDSDEAIRLNILKNLGSFLGACKFERVLFVVLLLFIYLESPPGFIPILLSISSLLSYLGFE